MAEMIEVGLGLLRAALWPTAVAFAALLLGRFALPQRRIAAWMIVAAFALAYGLGHALAAGAEWTLRPTRNWEWMFYLAPLAGIAGVISSSSRASWSSRCVLVALMALLAAGLLTARPTLWAPRALCLLLVFSYYIALLSALEPLATRVNPGTLAAAYAIAAAAAGAMIAEQISLTDGQIVMAAAGAFTGVALAAWMVKDCDPALGISVPFVIVIGGWAWIEALFEARLWPLALIAASPVAIWCVQVKPLKQSRPAAAAAVGLACMIAVIVVAAALLHSPAAE